MTIRHHPNRIASLALLIYAIHFQTPRVGEIYAPLTPLSFSTVSPVHRCLPTLMIAIAFSRRKSLHYPLALRRDGDRFDEIDTPPVAVFAHLSRIPHHLECGALPLSHGLDISVAREITFICRLGRFFNSFFFYTIKPVVRWLVRFISLECNSAFTCAGCFYT